MKGARRAATLAALVTLPLGAVPAVASAAADGPLFTDGEAQPVFSATDVVRESLWVRAPVDSDRDGRDDEVYTEVVRQKATDRGLKVPVVFFNSPYFSGGNDVANHNVDVELYVPNKRGGHDRRDGSVLKAQADERIAAAVGSAAGPNAGPITSGRYEAYFIERGFAVVYAESLGTGKSTGCPTSGGRNETIGSKSVIDWLNGRAPARDAAGSPVKASWSTGKVGMMGVSYNGTLPNAVASTGVRGLETIVPIAAISSWYDYYRADGAVVAPGTFQGEDLDVLAEYVYTREDREICKPVIAEVAAKQDRVTGDYSPFWDERNYVDDAHKVRASVLAVHGLSDWNVKVKHVAQWYEALRRNGVEHKIWLHRAGHTDPDTLRSPEWRRTLNRWFSHYLYGVDNGIEREPKSTVQREDGSWVDEADWPAPGTAKAELFPWAGGSAKGALRTSQLPGRPVVESLRDDSSKTAEALADLPSSGNRLSYATRAATTPLRLSGTARVDLAISFDRPAANVTALLVDRAPDGSSHVITRGWTDPQNRVSPSRTKPIRPGERYRVEVELEPQDYVVAAGHSLEFVLISSDYDYTLRPKPGAGLSIDLTGTAVELPVVGGAASLRESIG
ncbi:Xaa-Pro dipeptidyl-peptidase [Saccharothrix coeruleofusca]|uniref:Xaa-Pro dipeptidyl-peptidase n=1 Tax=Saccharothrix coeruleofusca TaxID=33919 RepID=A0A918EC27_9PSEU|nr:Xaa-Pro dipeptidyl-peptidase [Saccharothrix coeruleofusca]GGP40675.1 Xaa-Pro dipeptidyl-peptidase [Saccharothrix coeruleofusca]